jgi:hypothetical protein
VAHFEMTKYPPDGRGDAEIGFEEILAFDRRGGFTIKDDTDETRTKWLARHRALGGPKLLERNNNAKKKSKNHGADEDGGDGNDGSGDDDDDDDGGIDEPQTTPAQVQSNVPSFRSDRRIVRLLIAQCFADALQQAFVRELECQTSQEVAND